LTIEKLRKIKKMINLDLARATVSRILISTTGEKISSFVAALVLCAGLAVLMPGQARAGAPVYQNLASGNLNFKLIAPNGSGVLGNLDYISKNDLWRDFPAAGNGFLSVEGYCGAGLVTTAGVDPQTILTTEFNTAAGATQYAFPTDSSGTCVAANKQNTSAYNNGGIAEFDGATYNNVAAPTIAFQPNGSKNAPYMVFYVSTAGMTNVQFSYEATDVDAGSNDAVSPVALQYRIGNAGLFKNLPGGYIADASSPGTTRTVTTRSLTLPATLNNQPQVQFRLIMADAAGQDEWVGINNITIGRLAPTAAGVNVGGRLITNDGRGISGATVTLTDASGASRVARSDAFGYYRFEDVAAGETYVLNARGKRFSFSQPTQVFYVAEDALNIDFVANPNAEQVLRKFVGASY
jgi:hypothetical protein